MPTPSLPPAMGAAEFAELEVGEVVLNGVVADEVFDGFFGAEGDELFDVGARAAEAGAIEEMGGAEIVPAWGGGFPERLKGVVGHGILGDVSKPRRYDNVN